MALGEQDFNDEFIEIIQSNDWEFPVVDETEYEVNMFSAGFVVLPIPAEVVKFWQELLDTQGDDGNFFSD